MPFPEVPIRDIHEAAAYYENNFGDTLPRTERGVMYIESHEPDRGRRALRNEFTAVYERDGDWIVAYCPEIPGANGQGRTKDEARANLAEAITLILEESPEGWAPRCP